MLTIMASFSLSTCPRTHNSRPVRQKARYSLLYITKFQLSASVPSLAYHFCTLQNFSYLLQFHLWHIISVHYKISAICTSFLHITKFQLSASIPSLAHHFCTLQNVNYLFQFQLSLGHHFSTLQSFNYLVHHFGTLQNFNYLLQFHLWHIPSVSARACMQVCKLNY